MTKLYCHIIMRYHTKMMQTVFLHLNLYLIWDIISQTGEWSQPYRVVHKIWENSGKCSWWTMTRFLNNFIQTFTISFGSLPFSFPNRPILFGFLSKKGYIYPKNENVNKNCVPTSFCDCAMIKHDEIIINSCYFKSWRKPYFGRFYVRSYLWIFRNIRISPGFLPFGNARIQIFFRVGGSEG